jgi:GWxTD domain-containing protein
MRQMIRIFLSVALLATGVCVEAIGQEAENADVDLPFASEGDVRFFVDKTNFRGSEGFTRQEFYVLLDANQLKFKRSKKTQTATMELRVVLTGGDGSIAAEETWQREVSIGDLEETEKINFPFSDIIGFDIAAGDYQMEFTIRDVNGNKQGEVKSGLTIQNLEGETLSTSGLLFASEFREAMKAGRFVKQGWNVIPNVTRNYIAGSDLRVFFEIYNLESASEGSDNSFILGYTLTDSAGAVVRSYPAKRLAKPGKSAVITEVLETSSLGGGTYYLQAEVLDRSSRSVVRSRRMVFLSTPPPRPTELTRQQKDDLRYYADIRYVSRAADRKIYDSFEGRDERMEYLQNFWKKLDPLPGTSENERLIEHIVRMRHVENNFAAGRGKRGSDTDKGRIYVKYGQPTDIQYNMASSSSKPFEVWTYENVRGVRFIFLDRRGAGVFELVHSTHRREVYNPNWRSMQ